MLRLDFEQLIMEMVFEVGYEKLTPATVAYYLRIPIKAAENALDELVRDGILELESDDGGRLFYVLPMADTPQEVLHQTILRRAHRGLGSEYTAAEIRGEDPHEAEKKEREEKERLRRALQAEARQQQQPQIVVHHYSNEPQKEEQQVQTVNWSDPADHPLVLSDPNAFDKRDSQRDTKELFPVKKYDEDGNLVRIDPANNPAIPMLLSFFWPGLGQIHNGQPGKGLLMFFTSAFLWLLFLGWVVTIYSVIDAGVVSGQRADERQRRGMGRKRLGHDGGDEQPALA